MGLDIGNLFRKLVGRTPDQQFQREFGQVEGNHKGRSVRNLFKTVNVRLPRTISTEGLTINHRDVRPVTPDTQQFRQIALGSQLAKACLAHDMTLERKEKTGQKDCVEIYGIEAKKNFLFTTYTFKTRVYDAQGNAGLPQTHKGRSLRSQLGADLKKMVGKLKAEQGVQTAEIELDKMSEQVNRKFPSRKPGKCMLLAGKKPGWGNNKHAELSTVFRQHDGNKVRVETQSDVALKDGDGLRSKLSHYSGAYRSMVAMQLASDLAVDQMVDKLNK
ncbi:hypothetical protein [Parendozoicomonas haliclonae]|uniref:Uncharacterized protein n=1 Tax=Parendozoicomonas haliclonae TaxID=1960125 RepID=A0A1X7ANC1_9GAMM|nr:hypothetical protein [Parendozoicomonas haliclonae]SMA49786.1 hypothetical protein EHSB41UT_03575 [Parendozoicomonas haliclonae]